MPINRLQTPMIQDPDFVDLERGRGNTPSNLRQRTVRHFGGNSTGVDQPTGFVGINRLEQAHAMRHPPARSTAKVVAELATYLAASATVLASIIPVFKACMLREKNIYPIALAALAYRYLQPERFNALLDRELVRMSMGRRILALAGLQDSRASLAIFISIAMVLASQSAAEQSEENYGLFPAAGEVDLGEVDLGEVDLGGANWMERILGEDGLVDQTIKFVVSALSTIQIEQWLLKNMVQLCGRWTDQPQRPDGESLRIIQDVENARPLQEVVQDWTLELSTAQRGQLKNELWDGYSTHEGGAVFSSFLDKLYSGFPQSGVTIQGIQSRQAFAGERLLPLLLAMQSDVEFAYRVFAIADAGLGACTDRPPLTFIDMELEAKIHGALQVLGSSQSAKPTETATEGTAESDTDVNTEADKTLEPFIPEVLRCEFQKLNKQRAISHIRDQIRVLQNGNSSLHREVIEDVMAAYQAIQIRRPEFFPNLPYRKFGSNLDSRQIDQLSTQVQNELTTLWSSPCPAEAVQHLLASDSWRTVLQVLTGRNTAQLQAQFLERIETQLELLTDQASEGAISEAEYARAVLDLEAQRRQGLADLYNTTEYVNLTHRLIEGSGLRMP